MKIKLVVIGKTAASYLQEGMELYIKRLVHYTSISLEVIPDVKRDLNRIKELESAALMKKITPRDYVILLDESGHEFTSEKFAHQLEKWMLAGDKNIIFIIGGAFGFGEEIIERANMKISLSRMTFSHQMVRLIFLEQLYRAFTILKGEPYHHR